MPKTAVPVPSEGKTKTTPYEVAGISRALGDFARAKGMTQLVDAAGRSPWPRKG